MTIARTPHSRYGTWCFGLLAIMGVACGGGSDGASGKGGASGSAGTSGAAGTGTAGDAGNAGTTGAAGTVGNAGTTGAAGSAAGGAGNGGTTGAGATTGTAGTTGSAGTSGSAGSSGARGGTTGTAGRGGTTGSAGRGGTTGTAGSTGTAGTAGGAMPSAGCNATGGAPMSGRFTISASGTQREYIIKIPAGYDRTHPYRLILAFHGAQYDAESVDAGGPPTAAGAGPYYGVEPLSGGSAIFVAGQAQSSGWNSSNDIPYVTAMIAQFKTQLCIDQSRIFAMGFSMGAIQTIGLGCAMGDVLRGIAPMSGSLQGGTCSGTTPIAYWGSHGTNDPTINISNGRMVRDNFRNRNHCTTTTVPDSNQAGCVNYQGCDAGKPVSWCEFDGVHQPPPYSGSAIWRFFSQF